MRKLTLLFPMAGQGARFGYRFKPFLEVQGYKFIEAAFGPFRKFIDRIDKIYFLYLKEQEAEHNVSEQLAAIFHGIPFETRLIGEPTNGPAQTISRGLEGLELTGPAIVSDCDHSIDVSALVALNRDGNEIDCALPTWSLAGESLASWSVAALDGSGRIIDIAEKALPRGGVQVRGIIGTYYFADIAIPLALMRARPNVTYISDVVRDYLESGRTVASVPIETACFFGDPQRLAAASPAARSLLSA